ncbi:tetratricopeptide repeat protein [bacterium]|nr:tetratricopeptide repeat protein [bacterium]
MLNWTLRFPKNSLKNCVTTRIPDSLFLLLFALILLSACATTPAPVVPPNAGLADPIRGTELAPNPDYRAGYAEYLRGNQEKARAKLFRVVQKSSDYYPAYLALGYSYLAENNIEYAESYIRKAIEINPDYAQAHFLLANVLEGQQKYTFALEELSEVARIDPDYPALGQAQNILKLKATEQYLNKGRELAESNPEEALRYLKAAHNMAPEVPQIPVEIATILLKENNCREAADYLRIAIEKSPEDLAVKNQLADCLFQLQDYQQARILYEEIALQKPGDTAIQQRLDDVKKRIFIENLPVEYQSIPNSPEITRAQLAAYLAVNLETLQKYRSENQQIVVDIIQHWAQNYIQKVVSLGIMDVYPNRTFQPSQLVTKVELAKAASRILEIVELSGQKQFPVNPDLVIPDIPPGHLYYRLVARPLSSEVISLDADGRFHASRRVSGAEAMSVVNKLKALTESL